MPLIDLKIKHFRNHENFSLSPNLGVTILTGMNGVGKTSLLEAISILGSGQSFRNATNEQLIQKGMLKSNLEAEVEQDGLDQKIQVEILPKKKKISVNKKNVHFRRQILNILPSITFSPVDHKLVDGDASVRRSFLDKAISRINFEYADILSNYKKTLLQRNHLLKSQNKRFESSIKDLLLPWDEQLVDLGMKIITQRSEFVALNQDKLSNEYAKISSNSSNLKLRYVPLGKELDVRKSVEEGMIDSSFRHLLQESTLIDVLKGSTSVGPHKDELEIILDGNPLKAFGSQGEKRTAALALRLVEVASFRKEKKSNPILLIDDVSSELDILRRKALVSMLKDGFSQVIITSTELPAELLKEFEFSHWDMNQKMRVN